MNSTANLIKSFPEMPNGGYWLREIRAGRVGEFLRAQNCPKDARIVINPGAESSEVRIYSTVEQ